MLASISHLLVYSKTFWENVLVLANISHLLVYNKTYFGRMS